MGMVIKIPLLSILLFSLGCEIAATRKNLRTAHMPVFAEVEPGKESHSNPYWVRITAIGDNQTMQLNDTSEFEAESPTLIGTLGTHYRFPKDYYFYLMTDGLGTQYDFYHWDKGKLSAGAFVGINRAWGVQIVAAKQMANLSDGHLTLYASIQLRQEDLLLECKANGSIPCQGPSTATENRVRFQNQVADIILGS